MAVTSSNNLRKGSKGNDVLELQKLLNKNGYNLAEDGSYGGKTEAAVRDYQTKNGLKVDGIVGTNTWSKLNSASTGSTANTQQNTTYKYEDFKYDPYTESDVVKQAQSMLQEHMANKPGEYSSSWQAQLNDTINKILNREAFSYDLNGDALYQQYKDQYTTQGQMAMMDTMGQAAAATGGYGNSYAQSVGQQAYQGYLQQLNDKVPELYQLALNQYNQEEQSLYNQAALMAQQEEQDYGRYRDSVSDYYTDLDYYTGRADKEAETDYSRWSDKIGMDYKIHSDRQTAGYQEKSDARELALSYLGAGVIPDSALLTTAGISSADAQALVKKVNEQAAAAKKGDDPVKVVDDPIEDEDDHIIDGVDTSDKQVQAAAQAKFSTTVKPHSESMHDAIMRDMYGSYDQYLSEMIANSSLTEAEKVACAAWYIARGHNISDNFKPKK